MSSLDELIAKTKLLQSEGHSPSQIGDELSLSMETVTWLLTQPKSSSAPKDVHIDWSAVASRADMLRDSSLMMLKQYYHEMSEKNDFRHEEIEIPSVIVGIAQSGVPIATLIAAEEESQLTIYHPKKHASGDNPVGSMSGSFASITGKKCLIIDDVITTGNTIREVVEYLKNHGAIPLAICVMFDKRSIREVDGVPVYPLYKISRVD